MPKTQVLIEMVDKLKLEIIPVGNNNNIYNIN